MKNKSDVVYGKHAVTALLKHQAKLLKSLLYSPGKHGEELAEVLAAAKKAGVKARRVDRAELDRLAQVKQHQGVVAQVGTVETYNERDFEKLLAKHDKPLILILDSIHDPHNFGACLRTADACQVAFVVYCKRQSVGVTPVVHKVASGASFSVPLVQVTNLTRAIQQLQELGIWVIGTAADAPKTVFETDFKGRTALVMGNEGSGMRKLTEKNCDEMLSIPMQGTVESLNISVATAVCLFEAVRQRTS